MIRLNQTQFNFSLLFFSFIFNWMSKHIKNRYKRDTYLRQIINPVLDNVKFESTDSTFTVELTKNGNFTFSFTTDSSLYLNLSHGEITSMYVKPGDNIELSLNTDEFDESC